MTAANVFMKLCSGVMKTKRKAGYTPHVALSSEAQGIVLKNYNTAMARTL